MVKKKKTASRRSPRAKAESRPVARAARARAMGSGTAETLSLPCPKGLDLLNRGFGTYDVLPKDLSDFKQRLEAKQNILEQYVKIDVGLKEA